MTSRYTRRSVLRSGSLGVVGTVTGCLASNTSTTSRTNGEDEATSRTGPSVSETLSMGESVTSSGGASVTIAEPHVRKIISTPDVGSSVHAYPAGESASQFLVGSVSAHDTDVTSLRLAPVLDGTSRESRTYRHSFTPGSSGRLSFAVPIERARSGSIEWTPSDDERYRWNLPDSVVSALGVSPRFEVARFDVPDAIPRGDPFTASLTVRNTGERDGRFLAAILDEGASSIPLAAEFTVPVPAGETVTHDVSGRRVAGEGAELTAILDWGLDDRRTTVSISE